jgi:hypothetical protein
MVFKLTCIFSMSTIDCKFFILEILCLLETGPKLYSIIIRNNNVCTSSAHDLAWENIKCNEGNILSHFLLLVFMVYLPIKPVDVVNIAFLFINILNFVCIFLYMFVANVGVGRASWFPSRKNKHLFEEWPSFNLSYIVQTGLYLIKCWTIFRLEKTKKYIICGW